MKKRKEWTNLSRLNLTALTSDENSSLKTYFFFESSQMTTRREKKEKSAELVFRMTGWLDERLTFINRKERPFTTTNKSKVITAKKHFYKSNSTFAKFCKVWERRRLNQDKWLTLKTANDGNKAKFSNLCKCLLCNLSYSYFQIQINQILKLKICFFKYLKIMQSTAKYKG